MRVKLMAMLANARIPLQVDVCRRRRRPAARGSGLSGPPRSPRARIRAYRPETSIAEKTRRWLAAGGYSRMKTSSTSTDWGTRTFDGETMRAALARVCASGNGDPD